MNDTKPRTKYMREYQRRYRKDYQSIFVSRDDYNFIRAYCDAHGLNVTKWLVILAKDAMANTDVSKMKPAKKIKGEK